MENKKTNWDTTKIVLAITAGVAVLALVGLLIWMVMSGMITVNMGGKEKDPAETGVSYVVSDEAALAANKTVVATVGDAKLTNGQLQVYYWSQVYDFISYYSSYISYLGVDFTKPLSGQMYDATNDMTWEEFFLEMALDSWSQMAIIADMAEEDGFALSQEQQNTLNIMIADMDVNVAAYGYKTLDEMLDKEMGKGTTREDYIAYTKLDYFCSAYVSYLKEKHVPTQAQIEEYYAANEAAVKSAGYGKDAGKVVDVRHILIQPKDGVLNSDGRTYTYTPAQWEEARQRAQLVYDLWLNGEKNEKSFGELAKKNSADGSAVNGGLYANAKKGTTVEEFDAWIFDENRAYGDHAMIKTVFGYHIMFYVEAEEAWVRYCASSYTGDVVSAQMEEYSKDFSLKTEYDNIALGGVNFSSK